MRRDMLLENQEALEMHGNQLVYTSIAGGNLNRKAVEKKASVGSKESSEVANDTSITNDTSTKPDPNIGDEIEYNGKLVKVISIEKEKGPFQFMDDSVVNDKRWIYSLSNDEEVTVYEGEGFYEEMANQIEEEKNNDTTVVKPKYKREVSKKELANMKITNGDSPVQKINKELSYSLLFKDVSEIKSMVKKQENKVKSREKDRNNRINNGEDLSNEFEVAYRGVNSDLASMYQELEARNINIENRITTKIDIDKKKQQESMLDNMKNMIKYKNEYMTEIEISNINEEIKKLEVELGIIEEIENDNTINVSENSSNIVDDMVGVEAGSTHNEMIDNNTKCEGK